MKRIAMIAPLATLLAGLGAATFAQDAGPDAPPPPAPGAVAESAPPPPPGGPDGPGPRGPMIEFDAIDADGDDRLTRAELSARAQTRIVVFDANRDGWLDRAELIAAMPMPADHLMAAFAPDRAGMRADRVLSFMEAGDNGRIEIVALVERNVNGILAVADANRDGAVTRPEADEADKPRWDRREARGPEDGPGRGDRHGRDHGPGRGPLGPRG